MLMHLSSFSNLFKESGLTGIIVNQEIKTNHHITMADMACLGGGDMP
jgi:hypothetical protein